MKKWIGWAAVCAAIAGGVARAEYAVVDLGLNEPVGVDAAGQVGLNGSFYSVVDAPERALLYSGGSFLDLGSLGGSPTSVNGISPTGQVVGGSTTAAGAAFPYLWTAGGTNGVASNPQMVNLDPNQRFVPVTINSAGRIGGSLTVTGPTGTKQVAAIYSNGRFQQLPLPFDSSNSGVRSINEAGRVAGSGLTNLRPQGHSFFYNGTFSIDIGSLGGDTSAYAINNNDWIIGTSFTSTMFGAYEHAFLYANRVMTDLGTLGGHDSNAYGINNRNQIVGGAFTDALESIDQYHAFISDGTRMTDLNSLITSHAANWILSEAYAINDNGLIAGQGLLSGHKHGFLLEPLLPGDANADGKVDFGDLLTLAQHYGQSGAGWEAGDFNGDGTIGFDDLLSLAQNYGGDIGLPITTPAAAALPEAGASVIVMAGLLCGRRRHFRTQGRRTSTTSCRLGETMAHA